MNHILNIFAFFLLLQHPLSAQCPAIANCPSGPQDVCDLTPNDNNLWNESYWLDPLTQSQDLGEHALELSISATDTCTGSLTLRCLLFLDLDNNGTMETVINSDSLAAYTPGMVPFDNSGNPNYGGGSPRRFDERPVPADQQYRFALETTGDGTNQTVWLRWNTGATPGTYLNPELPYGTHKIRWIATNSPGDQDSCEYTFTVRDCKKPTVVCLNGISVNIMPTGIITLWAVDFLQYAEDNHTPSGQLVLGIRKSGTGTGFPLDSLGAPVISVTFTCAELGTHPIELWAKDKSGNTDYCEIYLLVQDNLFTCPGSNPVYMDTRFCARLWCTQSTLPGLVTWGFPAPLNTLYQPDAEGCYAPDSFLNVPAMNFTITPVVADSDPLNGVDVFDLIQINKHILGLKPLPLPFGVIAADANNSRSVTTFDVVETRKLLLGEYTEFPNNTSWRLIDGSYTFPNAANPFLQIFPEMIVLTPINDTITGDVLFYGVKTGDVDCTAIPGLTGSTPETRSVLALNAFDAVLQTGETIDLPIFPSEAGDWVGLQFGLAFDAERLSVEAVLPGSLPNWDGNTTAQPRPGLLNAVWFDVTPQAVNPEQPLFTLRLKAAAPVRLGESLTLAAGRLHPKAYTGDLEPRNLQLEFLPATPATGIGSPAPNPTASGAVLPVQFAENTAVHIEIRDMQGRQTWEFKTMAGKGQQHLVIPAEAFPAPGVYVWRVLAGMMEKSGKMVVDRR